MEGIYSPKFMFLKGLRFGLNVDESVSDTAIFIYTYTYVNYRYIFIIDRFRGLPITSERFLN